MACLDKYINTKVQPHCFRLILKGGILNLLYQKLSLLYFLLFSISDCSLCQCDI